MSVKKKKKKEKKKKKVRRGKKRCSSKCRSVRNPRHCILPEDLYLVPVLAFSSENPLTWLCLSISKTKDAGLCNLWVFYFLSFTLLKSLAAFMISYFRCLWALISYSKCLNLMEYYDFSIISSIYIFLLLTITKKAIDLEMPLLHYVPRVWASFSQKSFKKETKKYKTPIRHLKNIENK